MISKVKEYKLKNGESLCDYLETKYSKFNFEWKNTGNVVSFTVYIPGLSSPHIHKWEIEEDKIYSINGSAISITPELNKENQKLEHRKNSVPIELLEIYNYVKKYHLEEDQSIDKVLEMAGLEFDLSPEDIKEVYFKVDHIIFNNL